MQMKAGVGGLPDEKNSRARSINSLKIELGRPLVFLRFPLNVCQGSVSVSPFIRFARIVRTVGQKP